jgi:mevalonate pyrophosphate decarboxylase
MRLVSSDAAEAAAAGSIAPIVPVPLTPSKEVKTLSRVVSWSAGAGAKSPIVVLFGTRLPMMVERAF